VVIRNGAPKHERPFLISTPTILEKERIPPEAILLPLDRSLDWQVLRRERILSFFFVLWQISLYTKEIL